MYNVLLVGYGFTGCDTFPSVMMKVFKLALGDQADTVFLEKEESKKGSSIYTDIMKAKVKAKLDSKKYDFIIGCGDTHFSNNQYSKLMLAGPKVIEVNNLPIFKSNIIDHVFYTVNTQPKKNTTWIGTATLENNLYVEERSTDKITVFVDHHSRRDDHTQEILEHLNSVKDKYNLRILYHSPKGIIEDNFTYNKGSNYRYKKYTHEEISKFYRQTDILMPTHRETQGMLAPEIAMCGGLVLMGKGMYPEEYIDKVRHIKYTSLSDIDWGAIVSNINYDSRMNNREFVKKEYSIESYRNKILSAFSKMKKV